MEVVTQQVLTLKNAQQIALAVVEAARSVLKLGESDRLDINIAICDAGGQLVLFERHGQAKFTGIQLVMNKAYTAAGHRVETSQWTGVTMQVLGNLEAANNHRFCSIGGGVPIRQGASSSSMLILGGLGVGGGSALQDEEIAHQALASLGLDKP
jgi:uncharacterized protein GlcG (DUF336 family)